MKVLIVFDDVTCFTQLESLIGSLDWLTPVSRIIITTRNKQVLRNWEVRKIYEIEALEYHHALDLFSRHAFKRNHLDVGYEKLSSNDVNLVMNFLNASGFYPEIGISFLVDKSLIVISNNNKITMHDLKQEFGQEIIQEESINPENRSRLWHHKDTYEVLTYNTRHHNWGALRISNRGKTEAVRAEVYFLDSVHSLLFSVIFSYFTKSFLKLKVSSSFNGENKCKVSYLQDPGFAEEKYFHWHGYPLKSLPSNHSAEKLIFLEMPGSDIEQLWDGVKSNNLKSQGNSTAGIIEDAMRIEHMGHVVAARWKPVREKRGFPMEKSHVVLARNEIPRWFNFQSEGSFITLEMPPDFFNNNRVLGFAFSAILAFSDRHVDCGRWFSFSCELKVKTTKDCDLHDTRLFQSRVNYVESDHLHFGCYLFCEEDFNGFWKCNSIPEAVHFNVFPPLKCECCGVKKMWDPFSLLPRLYEFNGRCKHMFQL
ncbi:ADP-ribosyl cyclase/cyclic ADP-ribose hydrolase [Citrus sinensis]|uniref:ADP-ribosyl cyclase/cyclic ADP-ribose hydrolase n=1 Tax=Citrus sinensis TaxID=2711 RepID=A0ACB8M8N8_CITSI|nr:ADP-ribosyl cyclase/cyclic ADP-ribose hydrolase [Citrus sinensis]